MRCISLLLICSACLLAQSAGLPRLGWVESGEPGRLLPVSGVAGAARLEEGAGMALAPHRAAALQPAGSLAALVSIEGAVHLTRITEDGDAPASVLSGAVESPHGLAWSPSGDVLLLIGEDRLQVWTVSRGGGAGLLKEIPVAAEHAAVADGGGRVLARADGVLYLIEADGAMQPVSRQSRGSFTFLAGSQRFAWLEEDGLRIGGGWGEPEAAPFSLDGDTVQRFIASSARHSLLLAESGAEGTVARLWTEQHGWAGQWHCPAQIHGLEPTGAAGVLRLVSHEPGPIWMADLGALRPSVFFVPAGQAQDANGGDQ